MAKTATLHVRVEPELKKKAEKALNSMGMSIAEAINIFLNKVAMEECIPFEIRANKTTLQAMDDVKYKRNLIGPFETAEEAIKELRKNCL